MATSLKSWAQGHEPAAVSRVVKRLERFSGNTTDPSTSLAAEELVSMINEARGPHEDSTAG